MSHANRSRSYELDGLKPMPVNHGRLDGNWVDKAREVIERRIATYPAGEARSCSFMFFLTNLCPDCRSSFTST
jgi:Ubiquitin carboxyl-terminal hydrolase, family 1